MNFLICDMQFGSTGKGSIAYYLAKTRELKVAVSANMPNAGHTAIDGEHKFVHMVLPVAAAVPSVDTILIGPGAVYDHTRLVAEFLALPRCGAKRLVVHPASMPLNPGDLVAEQGLVSIGSTMKGSAAANMRRMRRGGATILDQRPDVRSELTERLPVGVVSFDAREYLSQIQRDGKVIEGAQGYSLSVYHGLYPYVTSRDTTPNQIAADCGLPGDYRFRTCVVGSLRTFPIRVANRFDETGKQVGTSGPCYPDQHEITWASIGRDPELTTVTRLPRRLFTFSEEQVRAAQAVCATDRVFCNFLNYLPATRVRGFLRQLEGMGLKPAWGGYGPDFDDITELHL